MTDDRSRVDLQRAQGVVVGDHGVQHNHHYYPPPPPPAPARPLPLRRPQRPPSPGRRAVWTLVVVAVLAGVGVCGHQVVTTFDDLFDGGPFKRTGQIVQEATGPGPWTVEGYGYQYTVEGVARTSHEGQNFKPRDSITITGYVTVTKGSQFARKQYQFRDQADNLLEDVPFEGAGTGDPPVNQRTKLVSVVWDAGPRASRLTITIHDFYWSAGQDLILRGIPVA